MFFQVSFLPCRGSGSGAGDADYDFDEDLSPEHRRLQRTPTPYYEDPPSSVYYEDPPTPYYEDPPSLLVSDTVNVDDMDATDSAEGSVTGASGTTEDGTVRENITYSYDGDDDDDDDEDICRELAQLN